MKRAFDLVLAVVLAPVALIVSILAAALIWFDCRANPLFRQWRVGRDGKPFRIWKLRTMRLGTAEGASHDIGHSQITPLGRHLRRWKVDELPQIWNVLNGAMSFVGPRPCLLSQTELIAERERRGVLALRPGITGPAQLAGLDMSTPARLAEADTAYCAPWSLRRDIAILLRTASGGGSGDAARTG